ncbi:MAG TPA: methyltransferase, partial [Micromonosporaceae bacterium]|nr:methyltransferase [Micromonosporaceae bacterium]
AETRRGSAGLPGGNLRPTDPHLLAPLVGAGAACLELGAGNGSIAAFMADLAGEHGDVVAVDLQPQHVRDHPRVKTIQWNVVTDGIPLGPFDVIHARLLLAHLPTRRQILADAGGQLAPGGVLCIEEWGEFTPPAVLRHLDGSDLPELYGRYQQALLGMFRAADNDNTWCTQVADAMAEAGLVEIETVTQARSWPGGSAGTTLPCLVSVQKQAELVAQGVSVDDLRRMRALLAGTHTLLLGNLTWSTIGRKPTGSAA